MFSKIWDYMVNKMPGEMYVSLLVMIIIAVFAILAGNAIKKADPKKAPKGLAFFADFAYTYSKQTINGILGDAYDFAIPYFLFLCCYIPLAFIAGLFGLASPMTYYTIPLCLAMVSWFTIQVSAIHFQKWDYVKGFASPLPVWLPVLAPINVLSKFSSLMSLSIRMFGNAVAGYIIMSLIYWSTGMVSNLIIGWTGLTGLNIFGVIIAPALHAYFDLFGAFIQTVIFVLLSMLLIATEIPAPVYKKTTINKGGK